MTQVDDSDELKTNASPKKKAELKNEIKVNAMARGCMLPIFLFTMLITLSLVIRESSYVLKYDLDPGHLLLILVIFVLMNVPFAILIREHFKMARIAQAEIKTFTEKSEVQGGALSVSIDSGVDGGLSTVQESQLSSSNVEVAFDFNDERHHADAQAVQSSISHKNKDQ